MIKDILLLVFVVYGVGSTILYLNLKFTNDSLVEQLEKLDVDYAVSQFQLNECKENELKTVEANKQCMQNLAKERAKTTTAPLRNRQPASGLL
jgi:hypothetical protein